MPELDELLAIDTADVSDDDFVLIFDNSAPTSKSKKASRTNLLKGVAREGGDHNFATSEITDLTSQNATIVNLNVTTGLTFDTAATLGKMYRKAAAITLANIATSAGQTVTTAITGVVAGDTVCLSFSAIIPDGLIFQAWVSAADTVSIRAYNTTGVTITGASYTANLVIMRFA